MKKNWKKVLLTITAVLVAAGLAGGSSDAAAVLVGMNRIFNLGLKQNKLMELGLKIGADVPFCIMRGTALAEGIGEKLTALPPMPKCPVLIAKPAISVSTKAVYEGLKLYDGMEHPDMYTFYILYSTRPLWGAYPAIFL